MSWTQVYVSGLNQTVEPSDEDLERLLADRFNLNNATAYGSSTYAFDDSIQWAGPGTTLFKRNETTNSCRGYAFLSFLSSESAEMIIERINNSHTTVSDDTNLLPAFLRAELSKPQKAKPKKKKDEQSSKDLSDLRLRRKRRAPIRKHPVIISSDKKKTGLGNKTK